MMQDILECFRAYPAQTLAHRSAVTVQIQARLCLDNKLSRILAHALAQLRDHLHTTTFFPARKDSHQKAHALSSSFFLSTTLSGGFFLSTAHKLLSVRKHRLEKSVLDSRAWRNFSRKKCPRKADAARAALQMLPQASFQSNMRRKAKKLSRKNMFQKRAAQQTTMKNSLGCLGCLRLSQASFKCLKLIVFLSCLKLCKILLQASFILDQNGVLGCMIPWKLYMILLDCFQASFILENYCMRQIFYYNICSRIC